MKILIINKFYFPRGGAEQHVFALRELLKARGHEVMEFAMADGRNIDSAYSRFFVSPIQSERVRFDWQGVRTVARFLYSFEAARKLDALLKRERPDIAHVHNIYHQLSPSILRVLRKHKVPIVMTLHDYKLLSPNYLLYHHGHIADPDTENLAQCVTHRSVKDSWAASLVCALETWLHRRLRLYENVNAFISPSAFLRDLFTRHRPSLSPIHHIPHCIPPVAPAKTEPGSYGLFVGRLSEEKGVDELLDVAHGLPFPIKIAGSGPAEEHLKRRCHREQFANVSFAGFVTGTSLEQLYRNARFLVVPSRWYENAPLVILEAMRWGVPVIAPDHGAFPEFVHHDETGILYAPRSQDELRCAMDALVSDPERARRLGENARVNASNFSADRFYGKLMELYATLTA